MKHRLLLLALLSSCGPLVTEIVEPLIVADDAGLPTATPDAGTPPIPDAGTPPVPDAGQPPLTGLPCEVKAVVEAHCTGCHGGQTYVPHLLSRADFLQPRITGQLIGELALLRMQPNAQYPMPPGGQTKPSAAEVAVIDAWVKAGMPAGACGDAIP